VESTDRAVSPVIGVILMVAITVILAAVIAAFVLDIGPGDTDPTATYDVDYVDSNEVEVTLNSLGSGADGIVVVSGTDADTDSFEDTPLTIGGESNNYEGLDNGDDHALIAYSGDIDESESSTDLSEVDNFAIIDNLDDL